LLTSDAGHEVTVEGLLKRLCRIAGDIEGITLSGGDPADQPGAVVALLRGLKARRPAWNVLLYTGYTLAEMRQDRAGRAAVLPLVDLLIDGPFLREVAPVHPLAGSGNQQLHALTAAGEAMLRNASLEHAASFNLAIFRGGEARLIGVSTAEERKRMHQALQLTRASNE
jgi:anaerobic ribonucleoside-triphosphate reductase activating protein